MSREKRKAKKEAEKRLSTRQFIGAKEITDYSLVTYGQGELVYFIVKPTNISVLSESSVGARIYALMTVLKGVAEIEMLCLNSRESFEDNKRFLKSQMEQEENPVIRRLLEQDQTHLDRIQVQMATAREFLIMLRLKDEKESDIFPYLSRIEKSLKEQSFSVKRADKEDIKRILAVYYEQNVTVLKGVAEIEMLCLNSRESFEDNKRFLKSQMEQEENPVIRRLLEQDQTHLDRIQVQMATAREFLIMLRLKDEKESDIFPYLSRIEKSLKEQSFSVKRADKEDIKRILAVYYEQNVTTEKFEDFDGERWIIPEI